MRESVARDLARKEGALLVEVSGLDEPATAAAGSGSRFAMPDPSSICAHEVGSNTLDPMLVNRMPAST